MTTMKKSAAKSLQALRRDIDEIDKQILELLNLRAGYAIQTAEIKRQDNHGRPLYRPDREAVVVNRMSQLNKESGGLLQDQHVRFLFHEIMSVCLALEKTMEIGFLGPEATFTHEAALRHFGQAAVMRSYNSIAEVFRATAGKHIAFGVVPVENSLEGVVHHTLDSFVDFPLRIVGEIEIEVHHNLLSRCDELEAINVIYSHEQGFAQCRRWLAENMSHCSQIHVGSTADAARRARGFDTAAIASTAAAERFKLNVLSAGIEDDANNVTRFLVIAAGDFETDPSGNDKTTIVASTHNRPGALLELIKPLSDHKISMTRVESRPSRSEPWEYVFFIDMEGHYQNPPLRAALQSLQKEAKFFKYLGSYPKSAVSS